MPGTPEGDGLFLDFYEVDGQEVWCWKKGADEDASQEFESKDDALKAWREDKLVFEQFSDLGN